MNNQRRMRRIAVVLSWINLAGLVMALSSGEMMHAGAHVAVGIGLYAWMRRIDEGTRDTEMLAETGDSDRIEGLESEVDQLRRELTDAQERLDFTERMLAKRPLQQS